jgi:hypothetical protein
MPIVSRGAAVSEVAQEMRSIAHEALNWLGEIAESIKKQWIEENSLYVTKVLNTSTDTAAADTLGPPPGVIWQVKRFAVTGGVNGQFAIYLNEAQPQNLLDGEFTNAAMAADETDIYVLPGSVLVVRFFNQPNNQVCTVNLRVVETSVES